VPHKSNLGIMIASYEVWLHGRRLSRDSWHMLSAGQ